ncbi:8-oxoguanine glycosylase ogg1 [Zygosaccharomyces mellis]|uniref:N-glycosylase/DNA lyase n=1 Tax=Zygosaccharomyces mellis TaxID=42258 RepID=A0A4C2E3C6_9SACH|nr:8-oxoguanine glycosylase ogg1 [Zygosaccharomyces mellis]
MALKYSQIVLPKGELCLSNVLQTGQAFRWVLNESENRYATTMKIGDGNNYFVVVLRQPEDHILEFASLNETCGMDMIKDHLMKYFRLDIPLQELHYSDWRKRDARFENITPHGMRMLGQEPWETLISFICSSNNNISRITKMCSSLCVHYGNKVGTMDSLDFYSFPTSDELVKKASETHLRELGFGYRAKFIIETAKKMVQDKVNAGFESDTAFLEDLNSKLTYEQMREHLMSYQGIGPKVADCVCLMGLRMDQVVPVDVHVGRIAKRDYKFQSKKEYLKNLAEKYKELPITRKKINLELDAIRLMFLELWGPCAGWAQGILFTNEVGKTNGATSTGEIKKRKLIKLEDTEPKQASVRENSKTKMVEVKATSS